MKPHVKYGLIVGGIGFFVATVLATAFGLCGPVAGLVAGAIAGVLTVDKMRASSQGEAAKFGAISALIAGGITALGQLAGAVLALVLMQALDMQPVIGQLPDMSDSAERTGMYFGLVFAAGCLGTAGVALSVTAGAIAGYLRWKPAPLPPQQWPPQQPGQPY